MSNPHPEPLLQVTGLAIGYGTPIVTGIDLQISPGEIVALLGPSGSGKSTLLATLAGIVPTLAGQVSLSGRDVTHAPIQDRRIGLAFQEPLLFSHLDVLGNVAYGPRRHGASRTDARSQAQALLAWVGLSDLAGRSVQQLSGGQAQRVALARALAADPLLMLLDEPFSALDADLRTRLATEVAQRLRERGVGAIHVTHDLDEARLVADRILRIVVADGGAARLMP